MIPATPAAQTLDGVVIRREDRLAVSVGRQVALLSFFAALVASTATGVAGSSVAAVSAPSYCLPPGNALSGVYHPSRLHALSPCLKSSIA
jgi:hypothetical protein